MLIYLLLGVAIGIFFNDWLGRVLLAALLGIIDCVVLAFRRWRGAFTFAERSIPRKSGIERAEIDNAGNAMAEAAFEPFAEAGITGWRLYAWQFVLTLLTTLVPVVVTGIIRDWLR